MWNDIAVIGMACRFPGAVSIDEFWDNLQCGRDTIREFSHAELESYGLDKSLISDPRYIRRRGVVCDLESFDHDFFGINPYEASITDPQHKVFLEICWEALENSGYIKDRSKMVIGLFAGAGDNTYVNNVLVQNDSFVKDSIRYQVDILNGSHFLTTRVSYLLNLKGPSISIGTGCSTSLVAITQACNSLSARDCDIALAGGVTIRVPQICGYLYQDGSIYSSDGRCRAFDAKASGTVPANGAGVVVLKRLEDAIRDGDNIDAVIKSYAINNDGNAKAGYAAPGVIGQSHCVATALDNIDDVENIAYIEAHGTGTILGDPIEVAALSEAFGHYTAKKNFCALGSVKTNIGHTDVAAGVAGFIKAVLVLKNKAIPPSLNFVSPNPHISFSNSPFYVCDKYTPLVNSRMPVYVGVSSFGIGGTNAHVILGQAPQQQVAAAVKSSCLVLLSAKTLPSLVKQQSNLLDYLQKHPEQHKNLSNIASTSQNKRESFKYRKAFICQNTNNLQVLLQAKYGPNIFFGDQELCSELPKIAFIFHGDGAIYKGCVCDIYHNLPVFRHYFAECCNYLDPQIKNMVLDYAININSIFDEDHIKQVTMFIIEYSLAKTYIECGIKPECLMGHGLGKYVAYSVAGVISLLDVIRLVSVYSMLVTKLSVDPVCFPSLENGSEVFSEYSSVLNSIVLTPPIIPVINVVGEELFYGTTEFKRYLMDNFNGQPQLAAYVDVLKQKKFKALMEIGFSSNLSVLIKQWQIDLTSLVSLASKEDFVKNAKNSLECFNLVLGWCFCNFVNINWESYYGGERQYNVSLPSYPFDKTYSWVKSVPKSRNSISNGPFIYEPYWELVLNRNIKRFDRKETWLVFADDFGLADKLVAKLIAYEQNVVVVKLGSCFKKINDNCCQINPAQKNDYHVFVEHLANLQQFPDHILHFWSFSGDQDAKKLDANQILEQGFFSLINFFQAAMVYDILRSACLIVITNSCRSVQLTDWVVPEKSAMLGFCLVLPQETSNLACMIDINIANLAQERQGSLIDAILNETAEKPKDVSVAYRNGMRFVRGFKPYDAECLDDTNNYLRQGGVYIILGGLGKIGLRLAEFLAYSYHAHVILIARNLGALDEIKNEKLANLRKNSASVTILEADVTNYAQMEQAFFAIKNKFSQVDGVFHLAGVINPRTKTLIKDIQIEQVYEQLAPKVAGTRILADLVCQVSPRFCVGFSSLSAILGGPGLCSYAAGNCGLDSLVESYQLNETTHWLVLNWDAWSDKVGLNSDIDRRGLSYEQGFKLLQLSLCSSEKHQLIPIANNLEQLTKKWINYQEIQNVKLSFSDKHKLKLEDLEASLQLIVQDCFGIKHIDNKDDFYDLGADSLSMLRLQQLLDQSFPGKFRMNDLVRNRTIRGLIDVLEKKPDAYASCLIPMKETGSKEPFFLVHPVGGGVFCYIELAKYLTFDRKFIAIQDPMLESDKISFTSIEDMAKYYINAIKSVQNKGPYFIGGYSLGSNIAFEMAYQLEAEGNEVNLIIIDGWAKYRGQIMDRNRNLETMMKITYETSLKVGNFIYTKDNFLNLLWKRMEMLFRYLPKKIISEIMLFKAKEVLPEYLGMEEKANSWQDYTEKPVRLYSVDGNHLSILNSHNAEEIARVLSMCF